MNVTQIKASVAALETKISEERGMGNEAKKAMLECIDTLERAVTDLCKTMRIHVNAQFDGRDTALAEIVEGKKDAA